MGLQARWFDNHGQGAHACFARGASVLPRGTIFLESGVFV